MKLVPGRHWHTECVSSQEIIYKHMVVLTHGGNSHMAVLAHENQSHLKGIRVRKIQWDGSSL